MNLNQWPKINLCSVIFYIRLIFFCPFHCIVAVRKYLYVVIIRQILDQNYHIQIDKLENNNLYPRTLTRAK